MAKKKEWKEGEIALAFFDKKLTAEVQGYAPNSKKISQNKNFE